MKDARFWILLLGVTAFLAGMTGGRLMARAEVGTPRGSGELADYEALLVQRFELSPERARCLHVLLEDYENQVARIQERHLVRAMSELQPELAELSQATERLVRNQVLPASQRAAFDRSCEPLPFGAGTH